jgi:hypothetical protein
LENFTAVPNEWSDHVADGRLTLPMFNILWHLLRTCTWNTGVWTGEAERIHYGLNRPFSVSQINRYLTRLHKCGYISRRNTPGRRGGYKILINNYAHEENIIRPTELKDWRDIKDVDASEMRVRCVGDASDDACEMRSNPDVPDFNPDVPNVQTEVSELVSQSVRPSASPQGNQAGNSKQQLRQEEEAVFLSLSEEEQKLMDEVIPVVPAGKMREECDAAKEVLDGHKRLPDALHFLKYNRTHKTGGLYIRSFVQWLKAANAGNLMNEYLTHDFDTCPKCKKHGVLSIDKMLEAEVYVNACQEFDEVTDCCTVCGRKYVGGMGWRPCLGQQGDSAAVGA